MAVDERALRETTDAAAWAKAFLEEIDQPNVEVDFGLMVGWFANAIETAKASVHRNGFSDAEAAIAISRIIRSACSECDGVGWVHVPEHGCAGNEQACAETCPVPAQAPCPKCNNAERPRTTTNDEEPF